MEDDRARVEDREESTNENKRIVRNFGVSLTVSV